MNEDIRTTQLSWIREGSLWLVSFSGGYIVISLSYFAENVGSTATLAFIVVGWVLLAVTVGSGILASFSAWKNLDSSPVLEANDSKRRVPCHAPLGAWIRTTYAMMMYSFLLGFLSLSTGLAWNVLNGAASQSDKPEVIVVQGPVVVTDSE